MTAWAPMTMKAAAAVPPDMFWAVATAVQDRKLNSVCAPGVCQEVSVSGWGWQRAYDACLIIVWQHLKVLWTSTWTEGVLWKGGDCCQLSLPGRCSELLP